MLMMTMTKMMTMMRELPKKKNGKTFNNEIITGKEKG